MATRLGRQSPLSPSAVTIASAVVTTTSGSSSARPLSDFDAGINSSAAWTEHLERGTTDIGGSLSDEELETEPDYDLNRGRPARALYAFEGKPEFRELTVAAGSSLDVLKEELPDGWSLVRCGRDVGLLPRTYYTVCTAYLIDALLQYNECVDCLTAVHERLHYISCRRKYSFRLEVQRGIGVLNHPYRFAKVEISGFTSDPSKHGRMDQAVSEL
jgi:hypothetical protein